MRELEAVFLKIEDAKHWREVDVITDADGVRFLCPVCFDDPPVGPIGCHSIICWQPHVDQSHTPKPGRWTFVGTNLDDLSLVAGSSSVLLTSGCAVHFHVRDGRVV